MPGFKKLSVAARWKFFPPTLKFTWLPGLARGGSTAVTSGVANSEGAISASGPAGSWGAG